MTIDWEAADKFVNWLSKTVRAALGIDVNEDKFNGLIHTNDDKERTVLPGLRHIYRQDFMDLLEHAGGDEWALMGWWASDERKLLISLNGERAMAFIQSIARKLEPQPTTNITMQNAPTPTAEHQEKKGLFRR